MDEMARDALVRLAAALERLAPPAVPIADPAAARLMRWDGRQLSAPPPAPLVPVARFVGVDQQIAALARNLASLAAGGPAHDMLLWGARGMGKSALVRTLATDLGVALVEAAAADLATLPALFQRLAAAPGPFLLFVDDIAFDPHDPGIRQLRSLLDGGVAARPPHTRLAVTSNHRHLAIRAPDDTAGRHARDLEHDQLALSDRFGLVLGFHQPGQEDYLEMCARYLAAEGLALDRQDALTFALARGGRSGRTAWHYRVDVLTRGQSGLAGENELQ
jgi:predicted AAA+ superfamily ATPase